MLLEIGNHIYMQEIDWGHISNRPHPLHADHCLVFPYTYGTPILSLLIFLLKKYLDAEGFIFDTTNTVSNFSSVVM